MPPQFANFSLVSVLRRPDGLFACLLGRTEPFSPPGPPLPVGDVGVGPMDPYCERIVPLRDIPQARMEPFRSVLEAWQVLGRVERIDGALLERLRPVLDHTVMDGCAHVDVPPLRFEPEPRPFRPTAANPRAYKGTKDRPPKPQRPRPLDLRPHLASPRDLGVLLRKLGWERRTSTSSVPALFGRWFGQSRRWLALYRALDLESCGPLRRALSRLAVDAPSACEWGELLLELPAERRMSFVELVVETGMGGRPCPSGLLRRAFELAPPLAFRHWVYVLLETLKRGGDTAYLLAGFELARDYGERHEFSPVGRAGEAPVERIREAVESSDAGYQAMDLWEACGVFGTARVLREVDVSTLPAGQSFLGMLTAPLLDRQLEPEERAAKAAAIEGWVERIDRLLRSLPERYAEKALSHLRELVWFWDRPDLLASYMGDFLDLLPRICRPPFRGDGEDDRVLTVLTNLDEADWARMREAPEIVLRRIEAACRRKNDAELIAEGLHTLSRRASAATAAGLLYSTTAVLKASKILGGLGRSLRREVVDAWRSHSLWGEDLETRSLEDLVRWLEEAGPVSRKLKAGARGALRLTPSQADRGRQALLRTVPEARWALLGQVALGRLAATLGARGSGAKVGHALRLYGNVDENRRALRRFLRAHFEGDRDYLRKHPRNAAWLAGRSRLNAEAWLAGMRLEGRLRDGAAVTVEVELDSLEALRLGTYVGSCTGLGGSFTYSAAAAVLDINKHVVYARTAEGVVLARQLLAVSDDDRLVCFDVYPSAISSELKRLFRDFDVGFARRLGIEVHRSTEDLRPEIARLLSQDWWDDGAWDLGVEEGEQGG